jgi:hypothetical protein
MILDLLLAIGLIAASAYAAALWMRARQPRVAEPGAQRILFPFRGQGLSQRALEAALRLARAENATLVPAFIAEVPLAVSLDAPLSRRVEPALGLLEAIEQKAAKAGVPVDSRIERGRTARHALSQLIKLEHFDRMVVAAATNGGDGFSAGDVAWLLATAPGEIVVLRPSAPGKAGNDLAAPSGPPLQPAGPDGIGEAVGDDGGEDHERRDVEDQGPGPDVRLQHKERKQHRRDPLRPKPGDEGLLSGR